MITILVCKLPTATTAHSANYAISLTNRFRIVPTWKYHLGRNLLTGEHSSPSSYDTDVICRTHTYLCVALHNNTHMHTRIHTHTYLCAPAHTLRLYVRANHAPTTRPTRQHIPAHYCDGCGPVQRNTSASTAQQHSSTLGTRPHQQG